MKHLMIFALCLLCACCLMQCADAGASTSDGDEIVVPTREDTVKRGSYLVKAMGCRDCHSPKSVGPQGPEDIAGLELSGYPGEQPFTAPDCAILAQGWALFTPDLTACTGPWGTSFAANITPDETGIGNWTLEQFMVAIREGKSKGLPSNRPLLPPMPWTEYRNLTDSDLAAMFAYLMSMPPVKNVVPPPVPPAAPVEG